MIKRIFLKIAWGHIGTYTWGTLGHVHGDKFQCAPGMHINDVSVVKTFFVRDRKPTARAKHSDEEFLNLRL